MIRFMEPVLDAEFARTLRTQFFGGTSARPSSRKGASGGPAAGSRHSRELAGPRVDELPTSTLLPQRDDRVSRGSLAGHTRGPGNQ